MPYRYIISLLLTFAFPAQAFTQNCHHCGNIYNYPPACQWTFIDINDTIDAEVVAYSTAAGACVWNNHAAMAIVKIRTDTIRLLLPCLSFQHQLHPGTHIRVAKSIKPQQCYSLLHATHADAAPASRYNHTVLTTAWGKLVESRQVHFPFKNCHHIYTNSFACKWRMTADTGTITGKVIRFHKMQGRCGTELTAAVMILATNIDSIRIILPCFKGYIRTGDSVKVKITDEPTTDISIPQNTDYHLQQKKIGLDLYSLDEFDDTIFITAFGHIKSAEF